MTLRWFRAWLGRVPWPRPPALRLRAAAEGLELAGFGAVALGVGMAYEPAGFVVAGVLAWWVAQGLGGVE